MNSHKITNNENFKYDVAFSFLQQDEKVAIKLADLLEGRFDTFIYSEKQAELAGKDGEDMFNQVFGEQARVVVVLYRDTWGTTKWTRIEMTAIKNRAFDNGYNFSLFIPLKDSITLPRWLPKTQIWFNYNRWGIESAASVIEYKIQEEGGAEKKETIRDRALRINREIESKKKREALLNSVEGVRTAAKEVAILFDQIVKLVKVITDENEHIKIAINEDEGGQTISLLHNKYVLQIEWIGKFNNTLKDSYLNISLWQRPSIFDGERDSRIIFSQKLSFYISISNSSGWQDFNDNKFYLSEHIANLCVTKILDKIK